MSFLSWIKKPATKSKDEAVGYPALVRDILNKRPPWVRHAINPKEAALLHFEICKRNVASAIEVGVASGFSSTILLNAMQQNRADAKLYSFDLSERCYYDESRMTGDALHEIMGEQKGFDLHVGINSSGIERSFISEPVDLIFIDASHMSPWAALDLLSTARFLRPGGLIALHDVNLIFGKPDWRRQNASRDIYRAWHGEKFRYREAGNLGFLVFDGDQPQLIKTITACLYNEWDTEISGDTLTAFMQIASDYDVTVELINEMKQIVALRSRSHEQFAHRRFDYQIAQI